MEKALGWLKVEYWYHVFIILGAAGIGSSLIFDLKAISNVHALLLFLGMFFIGMGEWVNHPLQTALVPPNIYSRGGGIITGHPRRASALGTLFDLVGAGFLAVAVYKIVATA